MEPALAWFKSRADSDRCTMTWGHREAVSPRGRTYPGEPQGEAWGAVPLVPDPPETTNAHACYLTAPPEAELILIGRATGAKVLIPGTQSPRLFIRESGSCPACLPAVGRAGGALVGWYQGTPPAPEPSQEGLAYSCTCFVSLAEVGALRPVVGGSFQF